MRVPMIVKSQIATDRVARLADAIVGSQVNLLVFDASPQALDEHVVSPGASAVHADRDAMLQQHAVKSTLVNWLPWLLLKMSGLQHLV